MDPLNDDVAADAELAAMARVFAALKDLDEPARLRVLEYVERRLGVTRKPSIPKPPVPEDRRADPAPPLPADDPDPEEEAEPGDSDDAVESLSPVATKWMKRNGLQAAQISKVFSLGDEDIELIARAVPGKSSREKLRSVLLLLGLGKYLGTGSASVDNEKLKTAMNDYGVSVGNNFAAYLKDWSADIAGNRQDGNLKLTPRGLLAARDLLTKATTPEPAA